MDCEIREVAANQEHDLFASDDAIAQPAASVEANGIFQILR